MELVRQEFNGSVSGGVASRDIVNHHHTHGRLLTKDERIELNKLVQQLETEFDEPGWQTWRFLHRTIGVQNIEEMCLGHRDQAQTILNLLLSQARDKRAIEEHAGQIRQRVEANEAIGRRNTELLDQLQKLRAAYGILQQEQERSKRVNAQNDKLARSHTDNQATLSNQNRTLTQQNQKLLEEKDKLEHQVLQLRREPVSCKRCNAAQTTISSSRKWLVIACVMVAAAVSTAGYFAYQSRRASAERAAALALFEACEFAGRSFSVGSIIDNPREADIECVATGSGHQPQWRPIKPAIGKGNVRQKRAVTVPPRKDTVETVGTPSQE